MKARYFIQLVMLSALWGASFILTRVAAPQLGPNVSAGLRMLLATLVLGAIMRALKHAWPTQHWRELLLIGFLAVAGPHLLYSWSALHLPGGYGALLSVTASSLGWPSTPPRAAPATSCTSTSQRCFLLCKSRWLRWRRTRTHRG